jgi:hypothetical protein
VWIDDRLEASASITPLNENEIQTKHPVCGFRTLGKENEKKILPECLAPHEPNIGSNWVGKSGRLYQPFCLWTWPGESEKNEPCLPACLI